MDDREAIEMMKRCSDEIKTLRNTIDRLLPKAEAYDAFLTMLSLLPQKSQSYGEDLAHTLDKRIAVLKVANEKKDAQS